MNITIDFIFLFLFFIFIMKKLLPLTLFILIIVSNGSRTHAQDSSVYADLKTETLRAMVIDGQGDIGIGRTDKLSRLSVKGTKPFEAAGKVTIEASSAFVTGVKSGDDATYFLVQVAIGDRITIGSETRVVNTIENNSKLIVSVPFLQAVTATKMTINRSLFRSDGHDDTVKFLVADDGKVGIGTVQPKTKFHVSEGKIRADQGYVFDDFEGRAIRAIPSPLQPYTDDWMVFRNSHEGNTTGAFSFQNPDGSQDFMTIRTSGNVGIGTTDPHENFRMQIKGGGAAGWKGGLAAGGERNAVVLGELRGNATIGAHRSGLGEWAPLSINPHGQSSTIGGDIYLPEVTYGVPGNNNWEWVVKDKSTGKLYLKGGSSLRYKKNIKPLQGNFSAILQAEPKIFKWKNSEVTDFGYIAEEFDALGLKKLVRYDEKGRPDAINYHQLPVYTLEVVKQLKAENDRITREIKGMKKLLCMTYPKEKMCQ